MKIIIINGPCGIGKSTVAEKVHNDIPLSFLLDIDAQRRFVSKRYKNREKSGNIALMIGDSILKTCLENKVDVIIDKMLFNQKILEGYYKIAKKYNAKIYEIILIASKELVIKRANERGYIDVPGAFTPQRCEYFWEEINKIKDSREKAHIINVEELSENEVYLEIKNIIN